MAHPQDHVGVISAWPDWLSPRVYVGTEISPASDGLDRDPAAVVYKGALELIVLEWIPDTYMQEKEELRQAFEIYDPQPIRFAGGRQPRVCKILKTNVDLESGAYNNLEIIVQKQWKCYIQEMKLLKSGANDSMLIQLIIVLVGEAFGGALAHVLSRSSEHSHIQSVVQAGIMTGAGFTVAGIGLRRFKRRLSDYVMKAGAMSTALAIIVSFAGLLPAGLAWPIGAATSILVATGLALV